MKNFQLEAEQKYQIKNLKLLTAYDVENLVVSAMEGGSNYWYFVNDESSAKIVEATPTMIGKPFVERMLIAISKGVEVKIMDAENGDEQLGVLNADSWAKAEELMMKNHRMHLGDVLLENDDASTGDVFFQLAVMGEVVFG